MCKGVCCVKVYQNQLGVWVYVSVVCVYMLQLLWSVVLDRLLQHTRDYRRDALKNCGSIGKRTASGGEWMENGGDWWDRFSILGGSIGPFPEVYVFKWELVLHSTMLLLLLDQVESTHIHDLGEPDTGASNQEHHWETRYRTFQAFQVLMNFY